MQGNNEIKTCEYMSWWGIYDEGGDYLPEACLEQEQPRQSPDKQTSGSKILSQSS